MRLAAMAAAIGSGGCSWIGVSGPPSPLPKHGIVTCSGSRSYVLPIVDTVVTAATVVLLVAANHYDTHSGDVFNGAESGGADALFLFVGLPYGISAVSGYSKISSCNDANGPERQHRLREDAARLTAQAHQQAKAENCATVNALSVAIRDADPKYYARVFLVDPMIARCMGSGDPTRNNEQAGALTLTAVESANNGDCATVKNLESQVRELDADIHDTVFVRDVAIARCLAEKVPVPPPITPAPESNPIPEATP